MADCIFVYNDSRCRRMRKELELGSSVISTLPYVFETAGKRGLGVPSLTIGQYTHNERHSGGWADCRAAPPLRTGSVVPAAGGIRFRIAHRLEYGSLTSWLLPDGITEQALAQIAGYRPGHRHRHEVRCGSVTMPGEGFPVAVNCGQAGIDFPKIKIVVDCSLQIGSRRGFLLCVFGAWQWYIVGVGALFMLYVGIVVKIAGRHMAWFDKILNYRPGFRRYVYGLAKLIFRQKQ